MREIVKKHKKLADKTYKEKKKKAKATTASWGNADRKVTKDLEVMATMKVKVYLWVVYTWTNLEK